MDLQGGMGHGPHASPLATPLTGWHTTLTLLYVTLQNVTWTLHEHVSSKDTVQTCIYCVFNKHHSLSDLKPLLTRSASVSSISEASTMPMNGEFTHAFQLNGNRHRQKRHHKSDHKYDLLVIFVVAFREILPSKQPKTNRINAHLRRHLVCWNLMNNWNSLEESKYFP